MSLERDVERCVTLLRRGYSKDRIMKILSFENFNEVYELARCRIRSRGKFSVENLFFDTYGLRYSTPEIIGRYRAQRVKGLRVADLSAGVGLQAIFFSFTNQRVLGIDIDPRRVRYARLNARAYNARNVEFIVGDSLTEEIRRKVEDYDVLFSDPARDETEEERKLETLLPSPLRILEFYKDRENFIFDLPPQLSLKRVPWGWEKEFISLNGRITRFTAYLGELRRHDRVAVTLPSGAEFWSDEPLKDYECKVETKSLLSTDYIYIVDESLYYARLLKEFADAHGIQYLQVGRRRTLAIGDADSSFLKPFRVLCVAENIDDIVGCFRRERIGKVTLRFSVEPEEYWRIRTRLERELSGEGKGSLFRIDRKWVGTENVT